MKVHPVLRIPCLLVARLLWLVRCPAIVLSQRHHYNAGFRSALSALWSGWAHGKHPGDTFQYLALAGKSTGRRALVDSMPGSRQASLALQYLSSSADLAMASYKRRTAERLAEIGVPVPRTFLELARHAIPDVSGAPWNSGIKLLLKPRHGMQAKGILTVQQLANGDFQVGADTILGKLALTATLVAALKADSLLVQEYVNPSTALRDLSPDAPPVIRVFSMRRAPGGPSRPVSAFLKLLPPGLDVPYGVDHLLLIPINIETGILDAAILFDSPDRRFDASPWTGAPVLGVKLPEWPLICEITERAGAILPDTPLIGWDILLGNSGPVILEANTGVSLFRAMLREFEHGLPSQVPTTLQAWAALRRSPQPTSKPG